MRTHGRRCCSARLRVFILEPAGRGWESGWLRLRLLLDLSHAPAAAEAVRALLIAIA